MRSKRKPSSWHSTPSCSLRAVLAQPSIRFALRWRESITELTTRFNFLTTHWLKVNNRHLLSSLLFAMSEPSAGVALSPNPPSSSLAPPPAVSRPSSAGSNRSNRSNGRPSSSRSSRNGEDRKLQSGPTTTISGGTSLGVKDNKEASKGKGGKKSGNTTPNIGKETNGDKAKATQGGRRVATQKARPTPIVTAPARPTSQNDNDKSPPPPERSSSAPIPKSLHTAPSVPRTALEAAADVAKQKKEGATGDALASLQKMISDLKAIPSASSAGSGSVSRTASGAKETGPASSTKGSEPAAPLAIPDASSSSKKLKADAPSFTPSFQAVSPVASQAPISPATITSPPWAHQQPRSVSHGSAGHRRPSNTSLSGVGTGPAFGAIPNLDPASVALFAQSMGGFPGYQNSLQVHQEADNEDLSPMGFSPNRDGSYQQQQLLAAQALQFQQIQLLQAQLASTQMQQLQQQQQQNQQQPGGFIAPRFQALAAQRAAQQQQQQVQQLAQATQLFELQQQQILEHQRRQEESARAAAIAEATLKNPPPVFEEDSPEMKPASLGPTGRPQLAPSFTFGAKRSDGEPAERSSMSPPSLPPVINRSEGIGGAAATGLAGLAARAHKRTGSELTPAMQEQASALVGMRSFANVLD